MIQYPQEEGPHTLPDVLDFSALGPFADDLIEYGRRVDDKLLSISLYWWLRVLVEIRNRDLHLERQPGFLFAAIGFVSTDGGDPAFGVDVVVDETQRETRVIDYIAAGSLEAPIVVHPMRIVEHAPNVHPIDGTAACWAVSRVSSVPRGPGLLTAKHVTGSLTGADVRLTNGALGSVIDVAPPGIDAALVGVDSGPRQSVLPSSALVAPWSDVQIGRQSGPISTKVRAVSDTSGIIGSPDLPARLVLAESGTHGDSGALVTDVATDSGVGLYIGEGADPAGLRVGIAQHLHQVHLLMDMEFYR